MPRQLKRPKPYIVVFCEGRTTGELEKKEFSQEAVLTMASEI